VEHRVPSLADDDIVDDIDIGGRERALEKARPARGLAPRNLRKRHQRDKAKQAADDVDFSRHGEFIF
jgi:hypothetical protein